MTTSKNPWHSILKKSHITKDLFEMLQDWEEEKKKDTDKPQVMPNSTGFLDRVLWNNHQTSLQSLVDFLASTSASPWITSGGLSMSSDKVVDQPDQAAALRQEILRYYETKWAHQRLVNGNSITPWRKDALRCLKGTIHIDNDEGLCQSLYWFYHSDQARERILAAQERDHLLHTDKVDERVSDYQHSVHLELQALDRNVRRKAKRWEVEYWWRDQQGRIYLWSIPQNDHGLALVDSIWHGGEATLLASTQLRRDWLLGSVTSLRPIRLGRVGL